MTVTERYCAGRTFLRMSATIVLLCILQIADGHPLQNEIDRCSREKSRKARSVLANFLYPQLDQSKYNMSSSCMLHRHKDMFLAQEKNKKEIRRHQWKCAECSKVFRGEHYIDEHMTNRHLDTIREDAEVCLADYCDVLHCDHDHPVKSKHEKFHACKPSEMASRHHLCEVIANKCFPTEDGPDAAAMHEFFMHQFCDAHSCSPVRNLFPGRDEVGGKQVLFYVACIAMCIGLLIWYICLYMSHKDVPRGQDLRRVRPKQQGFMGFLWGKSKKKKIY
mmetsp:Transcript_38023/g.82671  ORF Transcript_38023/g.82671 Transcript_38023/m.82671 type:complete len:277 (-) Transcript_38023:113-943(-)|eukprot:CAMPEP_0118928768 /NCGR_PEP_ID=MMETSP1169-20130426/5945_1 /TAXON_ID=36882 /ORGANISM="Pyramimonas obovata, Strain CCMP722" /LENGTH=276 /DNA_ID=CAMNT_0006870819 /DNA_START=127 /DNA_END=957 /DNA_ORIENTATION=-